MTQNSKDLGQAPNSEGKPKNQSSIVVLGCFVFLILSVCVLAGFGAFFAFSFHGEQQRLAKNDTIEIQKKMLAAQAEAERAKALEARIRRDQEVALQVEMKRKAAEAKALEAARLKEAQALSDAAKEAKLNDTEAKRAARESELKKQLAEREKEEAAVDGQRSMLKVAQGAVTIGQIPRLGVSEGQQGEISKRLKQLVTDYANKKASLSKLKRVLLILDKIINTQSFSAQQYQELDAELKSS